MSSLQDGPVHVACSLAGGAQNSFGIIQFTCSDIIVYCRHHLPIKCLRFVLLYYYEYEYEYEYFLRCLLMLNVLHSCVSLYVMLRYVTLRYVSTTFACIDFSTFLFLCLLQYCLCWKRYSTLDPDRGDYHG